MREFVVSFVLPLAKFAFLSSRQLKSQGLTVALK